MAEIKLNGSILQITGDLTADTEFRRYPFRRTALVRPAN
jgi:hypothetical protein